MAILKRYRRPCSSLVLLLMLLLVPASGTARSGKKAPQALPDLTEISLEELANIEVTTVAKKEQKLSKVAAAVYVVTQEDIRRSGLTTIPEVLRMVPGLEVARIDGATWAIRCNVGLVSRNGARGSRVERLP